MVAAALDEPQKLPRYGIFFSSGRAPAPTSQAAVGIFHSAPPAASGNGRLKAIASFDFQCLAAPRAQTAQLLH